MGKEQELRLDGFAEKVAKALAERHVKLRDLEAEIGVSKSATSRAARGKSVSAENFVALWNWLRRSSSDEQAEVVAWACVNCNSPRSIDPCPKCGTPLTKPADGWDWPTLPDIDRIRTLAREVGYAVGVHGSLERDLDLIAAPWVVDAVDPFTLAQHIATGLDGEVIDYKNQDKPCGRWSCNIHTSDWTKMIDLSVMPPASPSGVKAGVTEEMVLAGCRVLYPSLFRAGIETRPHDGPATRARMAETVKQVREILTAALGVGDEGMGEASK